MIKKILLASSLLTMMSIPTLAQDKKPDPEVYGIVIAYTKTCDISPEFAKSALEIGLKMSDIDPNDKDSIAEANKIAGAYLMMDHGYSATYRFCQRMTGLLMSLGAHE